MSGLILRLSTLQSPVFLLNSRLGHFSAASRRRRPFSRSYRTNLPSSLATIHSSTLGFSPRLPVSVYGTGLFYLCLEGFLGSFYPHFPLSRSLVVLSGSAGSADLPTVPIPTPFNVHFRQYAVVSLLRRPITVKKSIGILTDFPSTTPFGFALGPD